MALVLKGRVVTFDRAGRVLDPGAVYVGDDGVIVSVLGASESAPPGFSSAPVVDTGGVVYPGLIDLHNHVAYNTLPLWLAPGAPYLHHDRWPDEPAYSSAITWPARVLQQAAPEALLKYVEVRAIVGGATSIQGAPRSTRKVDGWLVRIVDNQRFGTAKDLIRCASLQKRPDQLRVEAEKLRDGNVLIYHVAEGTAGSIVTREFADLGGNGCLQPGLVGVHATALGDGDFQRWQDAVRAIDAEQRATVVWSPFSNLWLYHATTDVVAAHKRGVRIAVGSDWSPSGTKNILGELKVADLVNKRLLDRAFSDAELCAMVTANPGDALAIAWGPRIGRLEAASEADLVVLDQHRANVHRNLIEATERHVRLVVIRGKPFYGTKSLMKASGASSANAITVAGEARSVVVRMPGRTDATLTWPQVKRELEKVRKDPIAAWKDAQDALAAWGGPLDDPEAPLVLYGDMPEGDLGALGAAGAPPADLQIPPLDTLEHDDAFFTAVRNAEPPELPRLEGYYQ
jgi:cytosine/adenosine deaminase-related metal-dependent hydrolase